MASIYDIIREDLQYLRTKVDGIDTQGQETARVVAILKDDRDQKGTKASRTMAYCAIISVVISAITIATACGVVNGKSKNGRTSRLVGMPAGRANFLSRKVQPVKEPVPTRCNEYPESPTP